MNRYLLAGVAFAFVAIVALLAMALSGMPLFAKKPCSSSCNVILVVIDTLAADHLKTYGYDRDTMPRTEAFFAKGVTFENAYSAAPWTHASFPAMYFSDLPSRLTFKDLAQHGKPSFISAIRDSGDTVYGVMLPKNVFIVDTVDSPFRDHEIEYTSVNTFTQASDAAARLGSESARTGTPFFLMLHTFDAHDPYHPKSPYDTKFGTTTTYSSVNMSEILQANAATASPERIHDFTLLYDQQLSQVDAELAQFLDSLSPEILKTTVVIVVADHGEAFWQHDHFWHGLSLYDEELHVPFFMRVPGVGEKRIAEPVSLLDLGPTILSFMHVRPVASFTGSDLSPLLEGRSLGVRLIHFENGYPFFLARDDIGKVPPPESLQATGAWDTNLPLIEKSNEGARMGSLVYMRYIRTGDMSAFDLASDPQEKVDILSDPATLPPSDQQAFSEFLAQLKATGLMPSDSGK